MSTPQISVCEVKAQVHILSVLHKEVCPLAFISETLSWLVRDVLDKRTPFERLMGQNISSQTPVNYRWQINAVMSCNNGNSTTRTHTVPKTLTSDHHKLWRQKQRTGKNITAFNAQKKKNVINMVYANIYSVRIYDYFWMSIKGQRKWLYWRG